MTAKLAVLRVLLDKAQEVAFDAECDVLDDATVQQLMQMALKRQQRTDPLHDSVTQLAMAMMPTGYQR